jgi:hypothetical protein
MSNLIREFVSHFNRSLNEQKNNRIRKEYLLKASDVYKLMEPLARLEALNTFSREEINVFVNYWNKTNPRTRVQ